MHLASSSLDHQTEYHPEADYNRGPSNWSVQAPYARSGCSWIDDDDDGKDQDVQKNTNRGELAFHVTNEPRSGVHASNAIPGHPLSAAVDPEDRNNTDESDEG